MFHTRPWLKMMNPQKKSMVHWKITHLAHLRMRLQYVTIVWLMFVDLFSTLFPFLLGIFFFLSHCQADMARKSRPGCSSNERHHIVSGRRRSRRGWETRRDSCHCPGWPMVWKVLKQAFCVGQRLVQWRNLNINITRIDGDYAGKTVVNGWWNGGVAIRTIAFQVVYDIA